MIGSQRRILRQTIDHSARDTFFRTETTPEKRTTVVQPSVSASGISTTTLNSASKKDNKPVTKSGDRIDVENCVTLYNTDKLDALPCIMRGSNKSEIPPSRDYLQNLEKSFAYTPIQVQEKPGMAEDCHILHAKM